MAELTSTSPLLVPNPRRREAAGSLSGQPQTYSIFDKGKGMVERKLKQASRRKHIAPAIPSAAGLPRPIPRKVIGEIRKKGEKSTFKTKSFLTMTNDFDSQNDDTIEKSDRDYSGSRGNGMFKRRIGMHAFSYEIELKILHKHILRRARQRLHSIQSIPQTAMNDEDPFKIESVHQENSIADKNDCSNAGKGCYSVNGEELFLSEDEKPGRNVGFNSFNIGATKFGPELLEYEVDANNWECEVFFDVLHLTKKKPASAQIRRNSSQSEHIKRPNFHHDMRGQMSDAELYNNNANTTDLDNDNYNENEKDDGGNETFNENDHADDEDDNPKEAEVIEERLDIFLFSFGSVVFWNFDNETQELHFMESLKPYMVRVFKQNDLYENANDNMDFTYSNKTSVKHDLVRIGTHEPEEKLAVSYAFAQSNLLTIFEWRLDKIIERNEHIPQELAVTGKMSLTATQISKEVGLLFMERNSINLASDVLDTPRFFWENDEWDPVYNMLCKYLEHENRIDVLNRRLDCVRELLEVLEQQAENQHASYLEWIIIWLITCEVVIQVFWNMIIKDILGYFHSCGDDDE